MITTDYRNFISIGLLAVLVLSASCVRHPVTGKRQFAVMSETNEIAMGAQYDPQIVAQFGLYENNVLQAYIDEKGQEMAATVDLGGLEKVAELELGTYLYQDAWIFLPAVVSWEGSTDGMKWESLARIAVGDVLARDDRQERISLSAKVRPGSSAARYVRMTVSNAGPCPDWHAAAGSESWLFLDEMVVRTE